MTPPQAEGLDQTAHPDQPADDRPVIRRFVLAMGGVVGLVLLVVLAVAQLRPGARVFVLDTPTRDARAALLDTLDRELQEIVAVDRGARSPYERYRRDVVVVAAAVQRAALAAPDNAPPRTLEQAGLGPDDLAPNLMYQSSGLEWRLLSSERLVLARGN